MDRKDAVAFDVLNQQDIANGNAEINPDPIVIRSSVPSNEYASGDPDRVAPFVSVPLSIALSPN